MRQDLLLKFTVHLLTFSLFFIEIISIEIHVPNLLYTLYIKFFLRFILQFCIELNAESLK